MEMITPTISPSYKQHLAYEELRNDVTRFVLFGGGAEGGKSWLGAEWLITNCYMYPGSKWFLGRKELTRVMASSYATFRKVCVYHHIPPSDWKFNGQYHYIEFRNPDTGDFDGLGSRIDLLDLKMKPEDPLFQRFGSLEYTGGWIEEAGEVHFLAFDVLKARVGRWRNEEFGLLTAKILLTCNPERNWLYRIFYKPWKKHQLPIEYAFIQALYKDNPWNAVEAEKRLNLITDPILRMRLKQGIWEYTQDSNSLVDYDSIIDLFTNTLDPVLDKYVTADVARYGSDKSVLGRWQGFDLKEVVWKTHRGVDQSAADLKDVLRDHQIPYSHAIADDDGVGGGVVDIARGIKGFVGNSSALVRKGDEKRRSKENYGNLRSQCGFLLAECINSHKMKISAKLDEATKELIIEDLQQLKKVDAPTESPLRLIPKEEIKDSLGRSPDFSDMMMMRMWFDLKPVHRGTLTQETGGIAGYYPGEQS